MNKSLFFLFTVSFLFSRITHSKDDEFDDDGLNFHSGPKVIDKDMKGSVDVEYTIEKQNQIIWNQEMEDEKKDLILPNFTIYVKTNFEEEELPVETNFEEEELPVETNFEEEEELPVETNFEEEDSEEVEDYTLKLPRGEEEEDDYTLKLPRGEEEEENTNEGTPLQVKQQVESDNKAYIPKVKDTLNKKTIYVECGESRFGCCYDGITSKIDHFGTNCFSDTYNIDVRDTPLLRTNEELPNRFRRPP
jgi:hypothetical protein